MDMRLQKVLAQAGLASRREAEQWIQAGRISVNGKVVTTLGTQADPLVDRIAVDGKVINRLEPKVYYLLNKPTGYVSTCDGRARPSNGPRPAQADQIPSLPRWSSWIGTAKACCC